MSAAKRKDDQKTKDQGKKEDHKTKKARIDAKKDTVSISKNAVSVSSIVLCELIVSVLSLLSPLLLSLFKERYHTWTMKSLKIS